MIGIILVPEKIRKALNDSRGSYTNKRVYGIKKSAMTVKNLKPNLQSIKYKSDWHLIIQIIHSRQDWYLVVEIILSTQEASPRYLKSKLAHKMRKQVWGIVVSATSETSQDHLSSNTKCHGWKGRIVKANDFLAIFH